MTGHNNRNGDKFIISFVEITCGKNILSDSFTMNTLERRNFFSAFLMSKSLSHKMQDRNLLISVFFFNSRLDTYNSINIEGISLQS